MIGYYAHSHGSGHCNFAQIFAKKLGTKLCIFTDSDYSFNTNSNVVRLANENPDGTEFDRRKFEEPLSLHYAPVNMRKITIRNQRILDHINQKNINLLIIDVSVEIAMLARVSSVPYAYVRLQGDRSDIPHINAFEGATFLLAYFPEELEPENTPDWIREKTVYLGFISKNMFESKSQPWPKEFRKNGKPNLLYVSGFGGSRRFEFEDLDKKFNIFIIGPGNNFDKNANITSIGVVPCTHKYLAHADFIVAGCGANTTSEILTLGKRFVAISENRPYDEQKQLASGLEKMNWAVCIDSHSTLDQALKNLHHINLKPLPKFKPEHFMNFCEVLSAEDFRSDELLDRLEEQRQNVINYLKLDAIINKPNQQLV